MKLRTIFSAGGALTLERTAVISAASSVSATQTSTGDFSVTSSMTTPLIGENVIFYVQEGSETGTGVSNVHRDLDFRWDFDDTGATYGTGQGGKTNNANIAPGRVVAKAWDSAGTKTVTCVARSSAGVVATKTVNITVTDPDTISWDNDYYVSFAGNFTGAPAEGGGVTHISTLTALTALNPADSTKNRINFRDDETYTWGTNRLNVNGSGTQYYVTRWGGGTNKPIIQAGANAPTNETPVDVFNTGVGSSKTERLAVYSIDADGLYDPIQGSSPQGLLNFVSVISPESSDTAGVHVSIYKCELSGLDRAIGCNGGGGVGTTQKFWLGVTDCSITDWRDYGVGLFGGDVYAGVVGNTIKQNPLANLGDGKLSVMPQFADHGPSRLQSAPYAGWTNNTVASNNGWSSSPEQAIQACLRLHPINIHVESQYVASVMWNVCAGRYLGGIGNVNDSVVMNVLGAFIADENIFFGARQDQAVFSNQAGDFYCRNNVGYQANVFSSSGGANEFARTSDSVNGPASTGTVVVAFNTVVSDRGATSGGNGNYTILSEGSWTGPATTEENNVAWVTGHSNGGTFTDYTPLSRADNFKPVATSAAIDAVSSGTIPVRDFDGNLRTATTNVGAHHDNVASDAGVTAPSNSVAPTIAEMDNFAGDYCVTGFGTWANLTGLEEYLTEWLWKMDGVEVAIAANTDYARLTNVDVSALDDSTGNLTCDVIRTNPSGTRVTATSNTIAV